MNLPSCIIKSITNCICIQFLRCLVRTHKPLYPTRNNYQQQTIFPTLSCWVFGSSPPFKLFLYLQLLNDGTLGPNTTPLFHRTERAAQSRSSSEPFTRWRPVISTLITAPLLRTGSEGRCCCCWCRSPVALIQRWRTATAPLRGQKSQTFILSVRPAVNRVECDVLWELGRKLTLGVSLLYCKAAC